MSRSGWTTTRNGPASPTTICSGLRPIAFCAFVFAGFLMLRTRAANRAGSIGPVDSGTVFAKTPGTWTFAYAINALAHGPAFLGAAHCTRRLAPG
jgi:hypothetical protein